MTDPSSDDPANISNVIQRLSSNVANRLGSNKTSKGTISEKEIIKQAYDEAKAYGYQLTGILNSVEMKISEEKNDSSAKLLHDSGMDNVEEHDEENIDEVSSLDKDNLAAKQTFLKSEITDPLAKEEKKHSVVAQLEKYKSTFIQRKSSMKKNSTYEPWKPDCHSSDFVMNLDEEVRETWGIFFCGGNKRVLKDLDDASKRYGIGLHTESFFW